MNGARSVDTSVLLVEDDETVRRIAALSLTKLGYHVVQAGSGYSALEVLENSAHPIKLVFSDVRMPGMTGDELARIVSRRWPGIPVLLTSGHARTGDFPDTDAEVLPKPYSRADLADALTSTLRARAADDLTITPAAARPSPRTPG